MANPNLPDPRRPLPSERARGVALLLGIPLGVFGAHRYYTGKIGTGLLMLVTAGGVGLWWLYDMITIAAGEFRDSDHLKLKRWWPGDETPGDAAAFQGGDMQRLAEQVENLSAEVMELAERLDFTERMLARSKDQREIR